MRVNYSIWQILGAFGASIASTVIGVHNLFFAIDWMTPDNDRGDKESVILNSSAIDNLESNARWH